MKGARGQGSECTLEIIKKAKAEDAKDPLAIPVHDLGYEENCKSGGWGHQSLRALKKNLTSITMKASFITI